MRDAVRREGARDMAGAAEPLSAGAEDPGPGVDREAIKALLIHRKTPFPCVHDLAKLLGIVERSGEAIPLQIRQAALLTRYAIVGRYSEPVPPVTAEDHAQAVAIAEAVVAWAEERLGGSPSGDPR